MIRCQLLDSMESGVIWTILEVAKVETHSHDQAFAGIAVRDVDN